jgi:Domain of unknown function (DUF6748)
MTTPRLISLASATCLLLTAGAIGGCGTTAPTTEGEQARRSVEVVPRSDTETFYFVNRQDMRKCAYPMCGGVFVGEVNHDQASCFEGNQAKDCYVAELDLTALGLSSEDAPDILAQAHAGQVLLRGDLAPHPQNTSIGRLVVTAAWEALTADQPAGTRYLGFESPIKCITFPCSNATGVPLNIGGVGSFAGFDVSALSANGDQLDRLTAAFGSDGAIVAGGTHEVTGPGGTASIIEVTAAYVPVKSSAAPTPCGDTVCAAGSYCCNASCSMCVPEGNLCTQQACAPCAHPACETGDALASSCSPVVAATCAQDSFCCNNAWDGLCVQQADALGAACGEPEPEPEPEPAQCVHSACDAGVVLEPGCSTCSTTVCAVDPYCCATAWDAVCVGEAEQLCGNTCAATAPACAHHLCAIGEKLDPQCDDPCVATVCAADSYCCNVEWDNVCVTEAGQLCGYCTK